MHSNSGLALELVGMIALKQRPDAHTASFADDSTTSTLQRD